MQLSPQQTAVDYVQTRSCSCHKNPLATLLRRINARYESPLATVTPIVRVTEPAANSHDGYRGWSPVAVAACEAYLAAR